jgi:PAS domain S-box-containing protein
MAYPRLVTTLKDRADERYPLDGEPRDPLAVYSQLLVGELVGDEAIRASQEMLQLVMDTIPGAFWVKDRNCVFLGINRFLAEHAGLQPSDIVGKNDYDMPWADGDPYGAAWYQAHDREVMETGVPQYRIKEEMTFADGTKIWLETNKVPLRDLNGEVIGVLGSFEDVTEKHLAEEARNRAMEELDERVKARTSTLRRVNETLRREVEERVRLEAQERKQRAYAEALRDTAAALAKSLDLDETLEQVLIGVDRLITHHLAAVILIDEDGRHTLAHIRETERDHLTAGIEVGMEIDRLSLIRELSRSHETIIRSDVQRDCLGAETRCAMGAPITVTDSRIGYLVAEGVAPGFFNESHAERLTAVADLAGVAISNAQLFSSQAELAALEERQRLARELHDAVSQTLWTANLVADSISPGGPREVTAEQIGRLKTLTKGALAEMRTLLLELRPASLLETRFTDLIEQLIDALRSRRVIEAKLVAPAPEDLWEPEPKVKHALYRIAQEALSNVARHSSASEVVIEVHFDGELLAMAIRDNGEGFDPSDAKADRLGLCIMAERAESVGASFRIDSASGVGTSIEVCAPMGPGV